MTYIKHNNTQISHLKDNEKTQTKYFTYTPIENDRVTHNRITSGLTLPWTVELRMQQWKPSESAWFTTVPGQVVVPVVVLLTTESTEFEYHKIWLIPIKKHSNNTNKLCTHIYQKYMTYIKHNNTQISHLKDNEKTQTKYFTYTPIENDRVTHNRMTSGPTLPWTVELRMQWWKASESAWFTTVLGQVVTPRIVLQTTDH